MTTHPYDIPASTHPRDNQHIARLIERLEDRRDMAEENLRLWTETLAREVDRVRRGMSSGDPLIQNSSIEINGFAVERLAYDRAIAEINSVLQDLYDNGLTIAPDPNA